MIKYNPNIPELPESLPRHGEEPLRPYDWVSMPSLLPSIACPLWEGAHVFMIVCSLLSLIIFLHRLLDFSSVIWRYAPLVADQNRVLGVDVTRPQDGSTLMGICLLSHCILVTYNDTCITRSPCTISLFVAHVFVRVWMLSWCLLHNATQREPIPDTTDCEKCTISLSWWPNSVAFTRSNRWKVICESLPFKLAPPSKVAGVWIHRPLAPKWRVFGYQPCSSIFSYLEVKTATPEERWQELALWERINWMMEHRVKWT